MSQRREPPTPREIRRLVDTVIDPCSQAAGVPIGIVAMGLVTELEVIRDCDVVDVSVSLGVTDPLCWMGAAFITEVRRRLAATDGVRSVKVSIDADLDWTEGHMNPQARERLARARAVRQTLPVIAAVAARPQASRPITET